MCVVSVCVIVGCVLRGVCKAGLTQLPTCVRNSVANTSGNHVHNSEANSKGVYCRQGVQCVTVECVGVRGVQSVRNIHMYKYLIHSAYAETYTTYRL